ncbi:hypothetical protein [Methylobacterium thuringiense]|uniref:Uncharacterized protein n=1 Tax=Methylobacterium thuringiense TaxID=1003091 RepID=A0ABQ4TJW6_9HYPH|nr:hypothetical protein [Methylobacterium thuringiense]GJE54544.1 hypothetical protein EKPJFOCH_1022 [Methylobacterium thuringiense]
MERELAAHLLLVAQAFADEKDLSLTTLGRLAAWDGRFFENIADPSKTFTARKYDEVLAYFSAHWPEDGPAWPEHISRPDRDEWTRIVAKAAARIAAKRAPQPETAGAAA